MENEVILNSSYQDVRPWKDAKSMYFLSLKGFILLKIVCVCVCACEWKYPKIEAGKWSQLSWRWSSRCLWTAWHEYREPNSHPLQEEEYVLLTTEPSLKPLTLFWFLVAIVIVFVCLFWGTDLYWIWSSLIARSGRPASPRNSPVSASPVLGLKGGITLPDCYIGAGDPNAGLHAFMASALPTKSSPQPL